MHRTESTVQNVAGSPCRTKHDACSWVCERTPRRDTWESFAEHESPKRPDLPPVVQFDVALAGPAEDVEIRHVNSRPRPRPIGRTAGT
jgi:hypothetical protein